MELKRILVVEDESDIRELIHFNLLKNKYEVYLASDGQEALNIISKTKIDLVLLDLMIPKINGLLVCQRIRSSKLNSDIPIIMVTAKGSDEEIITGLEAGANNYVTKPFRPKVLMARVKSAIKNSVTEEKPELLELHGITIDIEKRSVRVDEENIDLTYSEFELLVTLSQKPGWVFSRSQLVDIVRGEQHAITDRAVDVHVVGLRKKLKVKSTIIESVRGVGYRMKEVES